MGTLCAFYGGLLTEKQRQALTLYYEEDYSLGEIADQLGCTRQSVHELIARSGEKLRAYEAAVGAAERMRNVEKRLEAAQELLQGLMNQELSTDTRETVAKALGLIEQTIEQEERDHGI
ncbi:MAG: DNA-binding protein [Clostridia bacterium]|nr:DNA-binding protein [Clostridia bacterium]